MASASLTWTDIFAFAYHDKIKLWSKLCRIRCYIFDNERKKKQDLSTDIIITSKFLIDSQKQDILLNHWFFYVMESFKRTFKIGIKSIVQPFHILLDSSSFWLKHVS